jgi:Zn-dependent oligopeptidase
MHGLCSEGNGNSTHLAKCPRDFVEAPSQMLENWCWQPAVLDRLSKHHTTGKPLPAALRTALIAAKNVHESVAITRQIYLATLDLELHSENPPVGVEGLQRLVDTLRLEITGIANPPEANFLRSFGHLMNQYSAAYYGYMWAEVISADMFATKFEADCMGKEAGMLYRKQVLAPGGTGKIMEHLTAFLGGRPPAQEPFLRSRGILQ